MGPRGMVMGAMGLSLLAHFAVLLFLPADVGPTPRNEAPTAADLSEWLLVPQGAETPHPPEPEAPQAEEPRPDARDPRPPPQRRRRAARTEAPATAPSTESEDTGARLPTWIAQSIGDSRWVDAPDTSLLGSERALRGPLETERHADGTMSFRGSGIEGCRYPDGTVQTRADTGGGDPCCHAATIEECECLQEDVDPAARREVLRQLRQL